MVFSNLRWFDRSHRNDAASDRKSSQGKALVNESAGHQDGAHPSKKSQCPQTARWGRDWRRMRLVVLLIRSDEPISNATLSKELGVCEREVRDMIHTLRNEGYWILSSRGARGYWLARTDAEFDQFRKEQINRARSIIATLRAMEKNR